MIRVSCPVAAGRSERTISESSRSARSGPYAKPKMPMTSARSGMSAKKI